MDKPVCNWCSPTEDEEYDMYEFKRLKDENRKATVSVYGGMFTVSMDEPGEAEKQCLSFPIGYCPFCGRPFNGTEAGT